MDVELAVSPDSVGINPRATGVEPLDPVELFGRAAPLILEIGSGKGRFLVETALERPEASILGVEYSLHYYRVIVERIVRREISNVRVINFDAARVVGEMLPPSSVDEIHIYFPDPWPKKKRQKRRIIRPSVVRDFQTILRHDGFGVYVTDHRDYFEAAVPVLEAVFDVEAGEVTDHPPRTNYEAKYRAEGRAIYQALFRPRAER